MTAAATRDPEATRAAILDAAEEVFLEKGFGNSAMSEIARRASVTKSLIHHHFGSKGGLWREVKLRRFSVYATRQAEMIREAGPTIELVRESLAFLFSFLRQNPELVRIMAWMFLERDAEECIGKDQALIELGVAKFREAQTAGTIRQDIDPRFIQFVFIGLVHHWFQDREHFIHDFGTEGLPEDVDQAFADAATKIFLEGVVPRD